MPEPTEDVKQNKIDLSSYVEYSAMDALKEVGCLPIMVPIPKQAIDLVYNTSDKCMLNHFDQIRELAQEWERDFAASDEAIPWTNVRFGVRDKRPATSRNKDKKFYLQFCREYGDWVIKNRSTQLAAIPELEYLFHQLLEVEKICQEIFLQKLSEMSISHPGIKKLFYSYDGQKRVPISIRVISYENEGHFSVSPHFDKSAVTILLPSDDMPDQECLIVAPADGTPFNHENLKGIIRPKPTHPDSESCALFITGAMLEEIGVSIPPTPHAVLPHDRLLRHVLVAFCNVPYMDTKHLTYSIVYKKTIPNDFIDRFK
jgi:hypothetical protein